MIVGVLTEARGTYFNQLVTEQFQRWQCTTSTALVRSMRLFIQCARAFSAKIARDILRHCMLIL